MVLHVNRRAALIVGVALAAASTLGVGVAAAARENPVEVVRAYFAAIIGRDVEAALGLIDQVGSGVPVGGEAAFLHPEAIADGWRVQSVTEQHRDHRRQEARVEVTLASRHGLATGDLLLTGRDGPWRLYSPLVHIETPPSPLTFVQVNAHTVPVDRTAAPQQFWLFPGPYQFYTDLPGGVSAGSAEPVMALPSTVDRGGSTGHQPHQVAPGRLSAGQQVTAAARQQLAGILDDCATFSTPEPFRCPFATDGEIDTRDGQRISQPASLDWHIIDHPQVRLVDDRLQQPNTAGFRVVVDKPGRVRLSGAGTSTDGHIVEFTVDCHIDITPLHLRATLTGTGKVHLGPPRWPASPPEHADNTCHRNP